MPSGPPPPRFRVVERGRRLELIDTGTGRPAGVPPRAAGQKPHGAGRWPMLPERQGFDGRSLLTTHRWYDAKAPRRVVLDPGTMQLLGTVRGVAMAVVAVVIAAAVLAPAMLALLLLPLALVHRAVREPVRARITGWLDGLDPA